MLIIVLLVLILAPVFFKAPLLKRVENEMNDNLIAKVSFDDFHLNLIRNFPNLSMELKGLAVVGLDEFSQDTLVWFKSFRVSVNLLSIISKSGPEINSIVLDTPQILAKVLDSGKANWDIVKDTAASPDSTLAQESGEPGDLKIRIKKFSIKNGRVSYEDLPGAMTASLENFNFTMGGKIGVSQTDIRLQANANHVNVKMDGIPYLKNVILSMNIRLSADLDHMNFTFAENEFSLNDLVLQFSGNIDLGNKNPTLDVHFNTLNTSFKSLISLIPVIYMNDFQEIETRGSLLLSGDIKGVYNEADSIIPDLALNLIVENAMFKYPGLPASVENINIAVNLNVAGEDLDKTRIDINTFSFELAGNPIAADLHIQTPISDLQLKGGLNGTIDLSGFSDVIPMEGIQLAGIIYSSLKFHGKLSSIEKEAYEEFEAGGNFRLQNFELTTPDLPVPVQISEAELIFSPMFIELLKLDMKLGASDIQLKGKLKNYLLFALKDEQLSGSFDLRSGLLDINEIMPESTIPQEEDLLQDTIALTLFKIPGNIDFRFTSGLNHVEYGDLKIDKIYGEILLKDSKLILNGLSMNLLDGSMEVDGEYNVSDTLNPTVTMNLEMREIDIAAAYHSFNMVKALTPFAKNLNGKVSASIDFSGKLGEDMMPVVSTIYGSGELHSREIQILSSPGFDQMKNLLKMNKDLTNTLKDVNLSFQIKNGRVEIKPFDVQLGDIHTNLSGSHGLDQSLNYLVKMDVPREYLGSGANELIDNIGAQAASLGLNFEPGETIPVNFKIRGKIGKPELSLGAGKSEGKGSGVKEAIVEEVKEELAKQKEELGEEVKEELNEEIENIILRAEKEAETIRQLARETADQVKKEAYANADKLEKEAEGKISFAVAIAKKAADKLREQGDKQAENIVREADEKAEMIIEEAREKADKLK